MAQALYRKWRPQTFDDVIGQEHVVRTLRNALQTEHIHHAYLLAGPRGIGKTTTARLIAKAVNCLSPAEERPCGTCEMCRAISSGRLMDLVEVDGATTTGVDNVRDLIEKANYRPAQAQYKVYVIDEVHMLSNPAFNALLKTLEEPPEHVIFVLATTEVHKIPETILSRCQRFEFRRIPLDAIVGQLQKIADAETITVEPEAFTLIARAATGSMRDAISLFDQMSAGGIVSADTVRLMLGAERREVVRSLLQAWLDTDLNQGLTVINTAMDNGADPRQLARQTTDFLRGLLLIRLGAGQTWADPTDEERPVFEDMASQVSIDNLVRAVEYFSTAAEKRRTGWQPQLALEMAFIQASQPEVPAVQSSPVSPPVASKPKGKQSKTARGTERSKPRRPAGHSRRDQSPAENDAQKAKANDNQPNTAPQQEITQAAGKSKPAPAKKDYNLVEEIRENWQIVIQDMRSISLGALLRDASVTGIDEQGQLVLSFQHAFHCERVNDPANRRELEDVLSDNFHYQINVRCLMNGEWHAPEQTESDAGEIPADDPTEASPTPVEEDELLRRAQEELGAVAKVDGA